MNDVKVFAKMIALVLATGAIAACGPQSPEDVRATTIAKCERQFGRMAPDPSGATALCTCMSDRLAEEGLEVSDMLGGGREKVEGIVRSCASQAGIQTAM